MSGLRHIPKHINSTVCVISKQIHFRLCQTDYIILLEEATNRSCNVLFPSISDISVIDKKYTTSLILFNIITSPAWHFKSSASKEGWKPQYMTIVKLCITFATTNSVYMPNLEREKKTTIELKTESIKLKGRCRFWSKMARFVSSMTMYRLQQPRYFGLLISILKRLQAASHGFNNVICAHMWISNKRHQMLVSHANGCLL